MTRNTKQASALIAAAEEISIEAGIMDPHQMPPVLISFDKIMALRAALGMPKTLAGPDDWEAEQQFRGDGQPLPAWDILAGVDGEICVATVHTCRADAQLIGSAKIMLAALKQAELIAEETCRGQHEGNECWNILREIRLAIAFAEDRA